MDNLETKRALAEKKVEEYRGFFRHIKVFVVINGLFYLMKSGWLNWIFPEDFPWDPVYFNWVDVNLIIWGIILAIHALYLYRHKFTFLKKWEDRQIKKYMDEDSNDEKKYR